MAKTAAHRPSYLSRLWRELGTIGGEHDAFIKVIIVERVVKAVVLTALGVGLLVAGHNGWLDYWADYAENQLNLDVGRKVIFQFLLRLLVYIGAFSHISLLALGRVPDCDRHRHPDPLRGVRGGRASEPFQGRRAASKPGCGGLPGLPEAPVCRHLKRASATGTETRRDAARTAPARPAFSIRKPSMS